MTRILTSWGSTPKGCFPTYLQLHSVEGLDVKEAGEAKLLQKCTVDFFGTAISAYAFDDTIVVYDDRKLHLYGSPKESDFQEVEPFIEVVPVGPLSTRVIPNPYFGHYYASYKENSTVLDGLQTVCYDNSDRKLVPYQYLPCLVKAGDATREVIFRFLTPNRGQCSIEKLLAGFERSARCSVQITNGVVFDWTVDLYPFTDPFWNNAFTLLRNFEIAEGSDAFLSWVLDQYPKHAADTKGVKSIETKPETAALLARLKEEDPVGYKLYGFLHESRTTEGTSNNSLLGAFLKVVGNDYEALKAAIVDLKEVFAKGPYNLNWDRRDGYKRYLDTRPYVLSLPGAGDMNTEKRSKKEWNLRKGAREQALGLGVDAKEHPKLLAAIEAGNIPLGLFHEPGKPDDLINTEFDLWEKSLSRPGWAEVLFEMSQNASRRLQYERTITPYMSFLFRIEKYLDRHTGKGKKWQAFPKFVQSQYELEMDEATEEGTTKRRSALTPIPDNEARTITVPYVAMAVSGVRTTYCYSKLYQVFEQDVIDIESQTPVTAELEKKLNGRDDYGLMYYTLTGTARNTGYPTFLTIFERRKSGTYVHFHRVHPSRLKEGKKVPAHKLIQEGYRYMAGNIRAEEITAQQGDLIFVKTNDTTLDFSEAPGVKEFESHAFACADGSGVKLLKNTAKSIKNRLGFIASYRATSGAVGQEPIHVSHPEHEPVDLPTGVYEVRRAKSWEANPTAVWVLNID